MNRNKTLAPATHKTPSGMGGVFPVAIIEDRGDIALVEVRDCGPDWSGYQFTCAKDKLSPLSKEEAK
jgi:hypothetical protein